MAVVECASAVWRGAEKTAKLAEACLRRLKGARVIVTGSTGLVCSHLVRTILCSNDQFDTRIKLILPVRSPRRAEKLFGVRDDIELIDWNLGDRILSSNPTDYFIHGACTTASRDFIEKPVETALGIVDGTAECLASAYQQSCRAFVYLSSMEVYSSPSAKPATEKDLGPHDPDLPRSSYPIAKLMAENIVSSFGDEYNMRTTSLRLAQTFGAGVLPDDNRVFAQFVRSALGGEDIHLATDGAKRNCYLSLGDATQAILTVCSNNDAKKSYNVANPDTYCSIREMAEFVLARFGNGRERVFVSTDPVAAKLYPKSSDMLLDIKRLMRLGWKPTEGLIEMYNQLIEGWNDRASKYQE